VRLFRSGEGNARCATTPSRFLQNAKAKIRRLATSNIIRNFHLGFRMVAFLRPNDEVSFGMVNYDRGDLVSRAA